MPASLDRNIRLYPWYALLFQACCWLPVFFLYLNQRVAIEDVLRLEALYYLAVLPPLLVPLILLRSCPRALMTALRNAAIAPRIPSEHRATFLSLKCLAGPLAFSGWLPSSFRAAAEPDCATPSACPRVSAW